MTVIEFLDPLSRVGESIATGDGKMGKSAILDIAGRGLREGVDVTDEVGF